jgi:hypothetical protein
MVGSLSHESARVKSYTPQLVAVRTSNHYQ